MNYYERHIGDYMKDTSHLSLLEHGIYTRLLDVYYTREAPIAATEAARLIGARSREERAALVTVLGEFFVEGPDGWHQKRCDEEIARYRDKQAKAKRSAEARWNAKPSQSVGNANASPDAMRTHSGGNADGMLPDTSNQTPDTKPKADAHSQVSRSGPEPEPLPALPDGKPSNPEKPSRHGALARLLRDLGVQVTPFNPVLLEWVDSLAITDDEAKAAVEQARFSKPDGPIHAKYLDPIIRDMRTKPKANGNGKPAVDRWWDSDAGIERKGRELGLTPGLGESWASFRARINAKLEQQRTAA